MNDRLSILVRGIARFGRRIIVIQESNIPNEQKEIEISRWTSDIECMAKQMSELGFDAETIIEKMETIPEVQKFLTGMVEMESDAFWDKVVEALAE